MRRTFKLCLMLLAVLIFASGCGAVKGSNGESNRNYYAVVVDHMGREVSIESEPKRIVSLAPSNTETAFALGLGSRIVGVTDYCNYPEEALKIDKVGGFSNPNTEAVIALTPDLVLAGNMHDEQVKKLEEMGVPVLVLNPESMEETFEAMIMIGKATGNSKEADAVIDDMKARLKNIESKISSIPEEERARVYYEVSSDPLMSAGSASLINEAITLAGGKNIFADVDERYPKVSEEVLIKRDPEFILFPGSHGSSSFDPQEIAARPLWNEITAVKENNLFDVSADKISRSGPRLIEAVEKLAKIFYPELFEKG
ncbi:ABC transporter substrate-binding protein [Phosphitispora sp. TUW77]|uniref:ABC transporter substrate-binding protein n=1 Tax=Phosphitispora sp. TUW77 TaxID=3152361 RepID=UPI003AB480A8